MKQIFQVLFLLLRSLFARITDKTCSLHLPQKQHNRTPATSAGGRFTQTADGIFTNGKNESEAEILLAGDLLCQRKQQNAYRKADGSFDFTAMFAPMQTLFENADLVVGNLETVCDPSLAYMHESITADGLPFLNAPPQFLSALKNAGFDAVCSANNHNCDGGLHGLATTLDELQAVNLPVTGIFNGESAKRYLLFDVNGIRVAFLAYATFYNFKSTALTKKQRLSMLNLYRTQTAKKDIADAKKDGADFVITYIHWGSEYTHRVSRRQKRIAKKLAKAGSDLIAGSHSHVLQPFDYIDGVPCLYSFGNFISSQTKDGTQQTILLRLTLQKTNGDVALKDLCAIPCQTLVETDESGHRVVPVHCKEGAKVFAAIAKAIGKKIELKG